MKCRINGFILLLKLTLNIYYNLYFREKGVLLCKHCHKERYS